MVYKEPHTCLNTDVMRDHPQLDACMIANVIGRSATTEISISISAYQAYVHDAWQCEASYRKTWITKQLIIGELFGDWTEFYNALGLWLAAIHHANEEIVVHFAKFPTTEANTKVFH